MKNNFLNSFVFSLNIYIHIIFGIKKLYSKAAVFLNEKKHNNILMWPFDHTLADIQLNVALEISHAIKPQWTSLFSKSERNFNLC